MSIAAFWQGPGVDLKALVRRARNVIRTARTFRGTRCGGRAYDGGTRGSYACLRGASCIQKGVAATLLLCEVCAELRYDCGGGGKRLRK